MLLVLTDFKLFWDYQFSASEWGNKNFIINVIVTILITTLCLNFLVETNRKSEEELRNQAVDIEKKNGELQKINAELDRFVYSASHDLRAPLLSIQGLTTVAISESASEGDRKYFSLIHERIIKLDEFIKEIIEYSRNSRTELQVERFRTEELINRVIENLKYLKDAERISFFINSSVPEIISDKGRVGIILTNIVANAIKYHNPRCEKQFVRISVEQEGEQYLLKIEDNGMGIAEESQSRIFEMFFRATEKSSGSGLGLYIVKEIVQRLGGTVCVQSVLSKGTLFTVKIPVGKVE
jgi:signal transduction histidine kinase